MFQNSNWKQGKSAEEIANIQQRAALAAISGTIDTETDDEYCGEGRRAWDWPSCVEGLARPMPTKTIQYPRTNPSNATVWTGI